MSELDKFDRQILRIVQRDCLRKSEVIAEEVALSASAVQRRLRRLRAENYITSDVSVINQSKVDQPMTFIAGLEIERENYEALGRFRDWVATQEHIQQLYYVTGSVDLVAIITARDMAQYDEISAQIMRQFTQIRRITTNVVLKSVKVGLTIPIEYNEE